MSDQATVQASGDPGLDSLPLLPRGTILFEEIPVRAVVLDALAPTLGHGCLVVRDRDRGAVVLVRDGALVEVHAFTGGIVRTGDEVLAEVQAWPHALVSAHRLDAVLVDVCEALVRGEVLYADLRLDWVAWPLLLADLGRRGGTYTVEIFSPAGRGVTCVAGGEQTLSYTDIHPSLGDPALLEAMASNRDGSVKVRRLATAAFAPVAARPRTGPDEVVPGPSPAAHAPAGPSPSTETPPPAAAAGTAPAHDTAAPAGSAYASAPDTAAPAGSAYASAQDSPAPAGGAYASSAPDTPAPAEFSNGSARDTAAPLPTAEPIPSAPAEVAGAVPPAQASREERPYPPADEVLPDLTWVAPWQTPWREEMGRGGEAAGSGVAAPSSPQARPSVGDMLAGLRSIAQRRLQLSASRVEIVLDEAAREQRPLDSVLDEIRAMSIRGVMPSTVDAMVAEMKLAAAQYLSN